jgi:choline dehydrogenase-like flavoprotein
MPAETEFCIVGAGPAGLVLANVLGQAGREVVVLESGFAAPVESVQALNRGRILGDPYADLRTVRRRQLGGTVNTWNTEVGGHPAAKYVPLDPIDLEARAPAGLPGWPIEYAELVPWYEAAQRVCRLGPFEYGAARWRQEGDGDGLRFDPGSGLAARVYQLGSANAVSGALVEALHGRRSVAIECGVTAAQLRIDGAGERADAVTVRDSRSGEPRALRAEKIVLAGGAIENARLLLASGGPCDRSGRVGRYFMEHPRDYSMLWRPSEPAVLRELGFFDQHEAEGGVTILGRLAFDEAVLRERGLPNASVTLLPQFRSRTGIWRRLASRVGLASGAWYPRGGAGWAGRHSQEDLSGIQLLLNLEQAPHPENSVTLPPRGAERREGSIRLDWRWRPEDQQRLETLRRIVASAFEGSGLGPIEIDPRARPDPNAHHHAGTTRMSDDPAHGVVDRHGRVHGLENVYCAGASVFPSAGFANPTLTIVALALRLGAHLAPGAGR